MYFQKQMSFVSFCFWDEDKTDSSEESRGLGQPVPYTLCTPNPRSSSRERSVPSNY